MKSWELQIDPERPVENDSLAGAEWAIMLAGLQPDSLSVEAP